MASYESDLENSYPPELSELSVRKLLQQSQTDIIEDDLRGLQCATLAYDKAQNPDYRACDPTAAGEAAAKAGLRADRLGRPLSEVDEWIKRSFTELRGSEGNFTRERIATGIIAGRIVVAQSVSGRHRGTSAIDVARNYFTAAETSLQELHRGYDDGVWIKYATMLSRHWATAETVLPEGRPSFARTLALRGMWRAVRSEREVGESREDHRAFVKKQLLANALVGAIASTHSLADKPFLGRLRAKAMRKLVD